MLELYFSSIPKNTLVDEGRLWRITAPNGAVNFLLGTAHISAADFVKGTPELNYIFNEAVSSYLFEVEDITWDQTFKLIDKIINHRFTQEITNLTTDTNQKITGLLPALQDDAWKGIQYIFQQATKENPYTREDINKLSFFQLQSLMMVSLPHIEKELFDLCLIKEALAKQKINSAILLQNVETSLDIFDIETKIDFSKAIEHFINERASVVNRRKSAIASNFLSIYKMLFIFALPLVIFSNETKNLSRPEGSYEYLLNKQREEMMLAKIIPHFEKGGALFATGLLHCHSKNGFIARLHEAGYKIDRIYETPAPFSYSKALWLVYLPIIINTLSLLNGAIRNKVIADETCDNNNDVYLCYRHYLYAAMALPFIALLTLAFLLNPSANNKDKIESRASRIILMFQAMLVCYALPVSWYHLFLTMTSNTYFGYAAISTYAGFKYDEIWANNKLITRSPPNSSFVDTWKKRVDTLYGYNEHEFGPLIRRNIVTMYSQQRQGQKAEFIEVPAKRNGAMPSPN